MVDVDYVGSRLQKISIAYGNYYDNGNSVIDGTSMVDIAKHVILTRFVFVHKVFLFFINTTTNNKYLYIFPWSLLNYVYTIIRIYEIEYEHS